MVLKTCGVASCSFTLQTRSKLTLSGVKENLSSGSLTDSMGT
uniref:Uncharacterized protein n=1 Tax=Anguilla anguilla TaxID=7936 RepID=A0A0E9R3Y3_ANGAN